MVENYNDCHEIRQWGEFFVLEIGNGFKVKRLSIDPDASTSMQYHQFRDELWNVIAGHGQATIGSVTVDLTPGSLFRVAKEEIHQIRNTSLYEQLEIIEVQLGSICEEDDIVRL